MPTCPQCSTLFEFTPAEIKLREKISETLESGPVPSPTLCPPCRMQRRMAFRNERHLYRRMCDSSGKMLISMYPEKTPFPVYEKTIWHGDSWDALDYGQDFDFSRPFFDQFRELMNEVPRPALQAQNIENSDYCNFSFNARNCYLSFCSYDSEGMLYSYWMLNCKDCVDCTYCFKSERLFDCTDCNNSYGLTSCILSHNSHDSNFLYDCKACKNCFGCVGLRNKSYCLFNEQLTKEDYESKVKSFDLQNPDHLKAVSKKVEALRRKHPHLFSIQDKTDNCTGDYLFECKDCENCFQIYRSRDCVYTEDAETNDALDTYHAGWSQLTYECYSPVKQTSSAFCSVCWEGSDNFYCDNCYSTSHCFGCVGLKRKQYCILNKQYTKEEYSPLMKKIVAYMKNPSTSSGRFAEWGEFFPITFSTHCYNESMAQEFFPMSREEVLRRGWKWQDSLPFTTGQETLNEMPQRIEEVSDSIVKEVLACEKCHKNYKIIPQELAFYRSMKVSVPLMCPSCRHEKRSAHRNARKLYSRSCSQCQKPFRTTYSADSKYQIVCESCYLKSVY